MKINETVCVVGVGYVGLPLVIGFSKAGVKVIGFDINRERIKQLRKGRDNRNEHTTSEIVDALRNGAYFTYDSKDIRKADIVILTPPTPVDEKKLPNLKPVESASRTVGKNLKKGAIVVLESTVYPGVTEEIMAKIVEEESGMKCGRDFKIGYSPERVNPGDREHTIDKITKVVAGMDQETTEKLAQLYGLVAKDIFRAKSIKVAEAAKVIENTQRDLNIALMNELAIIFRKMGISIWDVLDASYTKWNFGRYKPGMVGGHCIPVDPYYLVYKAQEIGYHPQVILAGRGVNDSMPKYIVEMLQDALNDMGKTIKSSRILIMGLTFKENVKDIRTSPAKDLINELTKRGADVFAYDPLAERNDVKKDFGIESIKDPYSLSGIDGIIFTVSHDEFDKIDFAKLKKATRDNPVIIDVRAFLDEEKLRKIGYTYLTL
ncbi:MAG: nucleotide sugar dehydrogenase [Candidatus Bathyarchaeia archaeon]